MFDPLMQKCNILFCFLITICSLADCQTSDDYVRLADSTYETGDKEKAKQLYQKAASMHNAEAHFDLAYKYVVTTEESIYHFSEAAKMGHEQALEQVLDDLLFRANSLTIADPELAYEIYKKAKVANPYLEIFSEQSKLETIRKCIEAGPFDAKKFISKYHISEIELTAPYGIWELAAEASRGGRFGAPDLKLTLQLISRGSDVPSELIYVVDTVYYCWKQNLTFTFNVCDYVSSGYGLSYCSAKAENEADKEYLDRINKLSLKLKNNSGPLLVNAFSVASKFFEEKAWKEELHGGSGFAAWTRGSIMEQKSAYLDLVEQINRGVKIDTLNTNQDADRMLNEAYKIIMDSLKVKPITGFNAEVNLEGMRSVQRLWIQYRDSSADLFAKMGPSINADTWKNWLTKIRAQQLREFWDNK